MDFCICILKQGNFSRIIKIRPKGESRTLSEGGNGITPMSAINLDMISFDQCFVGKVNLNSDISKLQT
jgi:hypothetical protein